MSTLKYLLVFLLPGLYSCTPGKQVLRSAKTNMLDQAAFRNAHVGISIFEPATGKYWFNYQGDRFFVPASNTKIPTCYAAMKYLGDSLPGIAYSNVFSDILLFPTGDPTFLHPDYKQQPVLAFLRGAKGRLFISDESWQDEAWGSGWSWNDYSNDYMAERSPMPIYGNVVKWIKVSQRKEEPEFEGDTVDSYVYASPPGLWDMEYSIQPSVNFSVRRKLAANVFIISEGKEKNATRQVPFFTDGINATLDLLMDTVATPIQMATTEMLKRQAAKKIVCSQPLDSMLRPMMHRSDNFFAEQSLIMVSNKLLGIMNDARLIDTLLKTDLKDLPQKPRWVDGSGLSRYNLFTPQDIVSILNRMQQEFGLERLKGIFPTGGQGTISSYYRGDSSFIYGKTGTLSGVVAFSGYLYTKKGKLLIFSTLVNNHQSSATEIRRAVEKFLTGIRRDY